ncbi:dihydrofolate reductase family protein [Cryptosporangium minutisporangium]|uniref:Dihydrofolate reductase family protein n=1 Tax=Cryptosporangium minutisporangium TaxID=113569 RepID=A0ABP6SQ88_9ACTN
MGSICASVFMTLDGVVEAPHVWHPAFVSEESLAALSDQLTDATAMLLGRRTYEEFADYWPDQPSDVPLADATNSIPKYLVSRTQPAAQWNNTTVLDAGLVAAVRAVKERERSVLVPGGAQLIRGLLREHLLDELRITLDPVIVGSGHRLLVDGLPQTRLELLDVRRLPHGVTYLVYRPERPA